MVLAKPLRPSQVVAAILFVRLLSVFLVTTWYVPDEYWQTLEVAHKHAFGYGALTWEWQKGIRSYLVPAILAAFYTVLKYTGLDYPEAVILLPRILQALLSTAADYSFYKWTGGRKWALFLILTSWFWFYTSGRTLLQTTETSLVMIALSVFPFKSGRLGYYEKESNLWVWVASVCAWVRPTSAALWSVLGAYHVYTTNQGRLRLLLASYLPVAAVCGGAMVALDSWFHGALVVTPWEFFRYNVLHDVASFYGTHPWYWYLTHGLPAVLGSSLVPACWAAVTVLRRPREHPTGLVLLAAAGAHLVLHSLIPHKEFRFLLPILPIFLYLVQDLIVPWSRKAKKWQLFLLMGAVLATNVVPAVYFGRVHQAGTTAAMPLLRDLVAGDNRSSVLFLMPCHSTPLYSHLHVNVTARYLHCDPPRAGETYEAEAFYNNPLRWWRQEHARTHPPTALVMFDVLRGRVEDALAGYRLVHELPHTQFPEGEVGEKVLIFAKGAAPAPAPAPAPAHTADDAL